MGQRTKSVAVTGGKGGTGKSTFAILYSLKAVKEGKRVLLIDCDVECPNDYLILGLKKLGKPSKVTNTLYPEIDEEKCKNCGLCVRSCRSNAMFQPSGKAPRIIRDMCSSCGVCWAVCPYDAIEKVKVKNGEIFIDEISEQFTLITGRSIPGIRETSPVVEQTREYAQSLWEKYDLCVIDTAAGSHCTVMSALDGADEAIAVTEPTPMGVHDLRVILKVLEVLGIPSSIALNQFDVGDRTLIEDVEKDTGVPISHRVPYSKKLATVYSSGNLLDAPDLVDLIQFQE